MKFRLFTSVFILFTSFGVAHAQQHSVAKKWTEATLRAIKGDFGRPTIHARNLFHVSVAMYDAWAAYDTVATPYLIGKTVGNFTSIFNGVPVPTDIQAAREQAVSFAAYRVLKHRFLNSPGNTNPNFLTSQNLDFRMFELGYDITNTSTDYSTGDPAALGNYIASQVIAFGLQDGSNEQFGYANLYYQPVNAPLVTKLFGNPNFTDFNRWQPLTLDVFIDQNGNTIPGPTPPALTPEWGNVVPFAMTSADKTVYQRDGHDWPIYHDMGGAAQMTDNDPQASAEYMWNYALVSAWSSHLAPDDNAVWDISPASIGNLDPSHFPTTLSEYQSFYKLEEGGVNFSNGYAVNPKTGQPYAPQNVTRGDYARVLAEFWADGPNSDTPPGHWYEILNYVTDHPQFVRKYRGQGPELDPLEFDVKAYFMLGGALHDAAITAWGMKGYYDSTRPISAIRGMAEKGQSSDPTLSNYHPQGLPLIPGFIEVVQAGDPLAGASDEYVGEIKVKAWRGPTYIAVPATDQAGVDWVLAKNWWPYQRPTFVSPPFPGFISGHSTYSRTAAEVLTALTGDPFFPGGMGEFSCPKNQFLVFEEGPSQDITLQWATYRDASDQCSLSRIWGGIHPPMDDIPGRKIGIELAADAVANAETYFFSDDDNDTFLSNVDCDDNNAAINPGATEICDGVDNDCSGAADDGLTFMNYYADGDGDGFGDLAVTENSCLTTPPAGFSADSTDCDDTNAVINTGVAEICDDIDNDCSGVADDGLTFTNYYADTDGDGFGNELVSQNTCDLTPPAGYVIDGTDCDDTNGAINTSVSEICDNIDNDCSGLIDDGLPTFSYYVDADGDGFGSAANSIISCETSAPANYVTNDGDCNDAAANANPDAIEVNDGIDNDCDGTVDETSATTDVARKSWRLFPNPTSGMLTIQFEFTGKLNVEITRADGVRQLAQSLEFKGGIANIDIKDLAQGVYWLTAADAKGNRLIAERVVKF